MKKTIWHMQRQCGRLAEIKNELFYLQASIDCLNRILNDQNPYPGINSDEVF